MFNDIYRLVLMTLHTIAPIMLIIMGGVLVWILVMSRKWKKQDPERYYRKY